MINIKSISMALMTCAIAMSCQAQQAFNLKLTQPKDSKTTKYFIYLANDKFEVPDIHNDSMTVKKSVAKYTTNILSAPRPAIIQVVDENGHPTQAYFKTFFIPGETLNITVNGDDFKLSGSDFYNQSEAYMNMVNPHLEKLQSIASNYRTTMAQTPPEKRDSVGKAIIYSYNAEMQSFSNEKDAYMAAHGNEDGCAVTAIMLFGDESLFDKMSESVKNGRFKPYLDYCQADLKARREKREAAEKAAAEAQAASAAGQKFIDFECEYDGKVQKLSDYVGKGQYVLVDFWASWCGPCKKEIPNLINVYNTYKGDKFNVIGVATWDKPDDTKKAIQQLGIPYPQIINAQKAGSDAYGIQGIPQIILFGPDGTILRRDLRGDDIEKAVKEYLGK